MSPQSQESPLQRSLAAALAAAEKPRDYYDRALQSLLGTKGKPIYDIQRGKSKNPSVGTLRAIEQVLGLASGALMNIEQALPVEVAPAVTRSEDGSSIALRHVDLSYSMGPGTNIDDYADESSFEFDAALLSRITRSPADRLFVASGGGDSMFPTIIDNDLVVIDTAQRVLNMQDRIWALSLYGAGAIKRLRTIGPDRILVISDNKDVDNQEVSADDIYLLGRVIWLGRRM